MRAPSVFVGFGQFCVDRQHLVDGALPRVLLRPRPGRRPEAGPQSRQQCFDGALSLLSYQHVIWKSCKPGNVLSQNGWFVSSLAIHDFLLAAVIVYMVIKHDGYNAEGKSHWVKDDQPLPTKEDLKFVLKRSHAIWSEVATEREELRKTADTLATILARLGTSVDRHADFPDAAYPSMGGSGSTEPFNWGLVGAKSSSHSISGSELLSSLGTPDGCLSTTNRCHMLTRELYRVCLGDWLRGVRALALFVLRPTAPGGIYEHDHGGREPRAGRVPDQPGV